MAEPKQITTGIADQMPALVTVYNIKDGRYVYVNDSIKKILGYSPEDFISGKINFSTSLVHPDDVDEVIANNTKARELASTLPPHQTDREIIISFEYRMRHKDGHWVWVHSDSSIFKRDDNNQVEEILNVTMDISERKEKEIQIEGLKNEFEALIDQQTRELQDREKMFRSMIEVIEDYAIVHLNPKGEVNSWNEGVAKILGYTEEEVVGQSTRIFFSKEDQENELHIKELDIARTEGTTTQEGIRVRKDGTTFFATSTITPIWDEKGLLQGFSKIIRDVTELKEAEETVRYHAFHDMLTGLGNRKSLDEHFAMAKDSAIRHGHKLALIFLDLDRFKNINDTLGHGAGDMLLKEVAYRLKQSVRKVDNVIRLGGDEFIILVNEVQSSQNVAKVADKIRSALIPITRIQEQSLHITASMGIAMFPADGPDIFTLLKNADTAMYRAKDAGRNRYQFYDYSMNLQSTSLLSLEQDLRTAVAEEQLYMEYQPFTDIATGSVLGVESLVRWKHPQLGVLMPFDFIPLAEDTGLIISIGEWILRKVCEEGQQLQEAGYPLKMTVNLSARQFGETELVNIITNTLTETRFDAAELEIEVTESVAMENINRTSIKLNQLKELGISIAIDDFGTGYSSLSYLKRFPVQKLKIDKSFVKHAITDAQDAAIIEAIISMAHSLGLTVCAEGIEDIEQLALLSSLKCDIAQGYLISRPLTFDRLLEWLGNLE
jgi:diguanylate cyclase